MDNASYANIFEAADDDLIAAVGTYFNSSGVNYTVKIYVNDELKLMQEDISPFLGYHTIKLNEYVSIKKGDVFRVEITSNTMPFAYCSHERVHYSENTSYMWDEGGWFDLYEDWGIIACIKAYTVGDDSKIVGNSDISVDYAGGKYFSVKVTTADGHDVVGAVVEFTINGKTTYVKTDSNGIAKIRITESPGKYVIKTTYNGKTYFNNVSVKLNLKTCKITANKNINVDYDGGKYFSVKVVSSDGKLAGAGALVKFTINGKTVTFKFNGKSYKVKINSKGVAQRTLKKNVVKKLKKGRTYTVKVSYLKDTIKSTVKVR